MESLSFDFASATRSLVERLRERFGRRAAGIVLALVFEALLILLLLTLGRGEVAPSGEDSTLTTFDISAPPEAEQEDAAPEEPVPETRATPVPQPPPPAVIIPRPNPVPAPAPVPTQPEIIPMTRDDMASADIANVPPRAPATKPAGPAFGPAAPSSANDTQVVGRAPDGSPLYAARWYREPTALQMRGYLSTASSPGWALIACKTAAQWRVEDCVGLDEFPAGSNIQRAALAAAWQFQVRPPRRGNDVLVGSWVRIRIEYTRR